MYLLDTCTLLWLASAQEQLSSEAKRLIKGSRAKIFVSSISALEIAIKARRKKLTLPLKASEWFARALEHHGLSEIAVDHCIAATSGELPLIHPDPFDRILVATAALNDFSIISPDREISTYKQVRVLW